MPMSCKCILDRMVHKGAMTEAEREKILRNLRKDPEEEAKKLRSDCINIIENGGGCAECIFSKEYPNVAEVDCIKICYDGTPRYSCTIGYPKTWVLPDDEIKDFGDVVEKITGEPCERMPWSVIVPYEGKEDSNE